MLGSKYAIDFRTLLKKYGSTYKHTLLFERLLHNQRYIFSWLELYAWDERRVTDQNTQRNRLPYDVLCVLKPVTRKLQVFRDIKKSNDCYTI